MLKLIKEDLSEEKEKFSERIQGAEVSLFIENIFSVHSQDVKTSSDSNELSCIVKNVIEKKNIIEKLQEKMSQRLGIINNLLANHYTAHTVQVAQAEKIREVQQSPNIVKNNIKLINLNLGQTKYSYNFYKQPINEHQYDWSAAFKKNSPMKTKKSYGNTKSNFKNKRHTSQVEANSFRGNKNKFQTINHPTIKSSNQNIIDGRVSSEAKRKSKNLTKDLYKKVNFQRRKSIDGFKGLVNHFFEPNKHENEGNFIIFRL